MYEDTTDSGTLEPVFFSYVLRKKFGFFFTYWRAGEFEYVKKNENFTYFKAGEFEIRKKTKILRISTQQNLRNVRNPSKNQRKID